MAQIKFKGCDISHWQRSVMFSQLKKDVDFVILKCGGSDKTDFFYIDSCFENYYKACKAHGIAVGCYWFAGKDSKGSEAGRREAMYLINAIKTKKFEYPIYLDFELGKSINKSQNTEFCKAFLTMLEACGFYAGIYSSDIAGFKYSLKIEELYKYTMWVARYGKEPQYVHHYHMWQYTSNGKIKSIIGDVDLDYSYINFPSIIRRKHLNGY